MEKVKVGMKIISFQKQKVFERKKYYKFLQIPYGLLTSFLQNSYELLTKLLSAFYKMLMSFLQNSYDLSHSSYEICTNFNELLT
jgi:hypothetical protein